MEANRKFIIPMALAILASGLIGGCAYSILEDREKVNTPNALVSETNPAVQSLPDARENRDEIAVSLDLWDKRIAVGEANVEAVWGVIQNTFSLGLQQIGTQFALPMTLIGALGGAVLIRKPGDISADEAHRMKDAAWDEATREAERKGNVNA